MAPGSDMGGKFIGGAIAVVIVMALLPTLAKFTSDAQNASGVSSQQSAVIGLAFTIFVLSVLYAVYQKMTV